MFTGKFVFGLKDATPALRVREEVFVNEQGFSKESEVDGFDPFAHHVMIFEGEDCVATGRLILEAPGIMRIGRIACLKEHRGKGYGDLVVRMLLDRGLRLGAKRFLVTSQLPVQNFYARFGFVPNGEICLDEGCPHQPMAMAAEGVRFPGGCRGK